MISVHDRRYIGDKHKRIIMPKLRNYQADRLDRIFLSKLNEKRFAAGLAPISEKTFGEVIDKLEVSCCQVLLLLYLFALVVKVFYFPCLLFSNGFVRS